MSKILAEKAFIQFFDAFSQALKKPEAIENLRKAVAAQEDANGKLAEAQAHHNQAADLNAATQTSLGEMRRAKADAEAAVAAAKEAQQKLRSDREKHEIRVKTDLDALANREAAVSQREATAKAWDDAQQAKIDAAQKIIDGAQRIKDKADKARAAWNE